MSSVSGVNLPLLLDYLGKLKKRPLKHVHAPVVGPKDAQKEAKKDAAAAAAATKEKEKEKAKDKEKTAGSDGSVVPAPSPVTTSSVSEESATERKEREVWMHSCVHSA